MVVNFEGKSVGDDAPVFLMADLGLTNGGDLSRAKALIDIACDGGADAVKFQMIGPDFLLGDRTVEYTYPILSGELVTENMYSMFQGLEYSLDEWSEIKSYAEERGLSFICTAHFFEAVDRLETLGVSIHKICTWSATHKRLVEAIGRTGKPLMLDTGVFDIRLFEQLLSWYKGAGGDQLLVLHDFHTNLQEEMNFRSIPFLKEMYGFPVGYTPQGRDYDKDFMAIGLGANILEKRLTIDRGIPNNGHIKALNPTEFKDWVRRVRDLELSLGQYGIFPTKQDEIDAQKYFKSLYAKTTLPVGTILKDEHLCAKRPGTGLSAKYIDEIIGAVVVSEISAGEMIHSSDLNIKICANGLANRS